MTNFPSNVLMATAIVELPSGVMTLPYYTPEQALSLALTTEYGFGYCSRVVYDTQVPARFNYSTRDYDHFPIVTLGA